MGGQPLLRKGPAAPTALLATTGHVILSGLGTTLGTISWSRPPGPHWCWAAWTGPGRPLSGIRCGAGVSRCHSLRAAAGLGWPGLHLWPRGCGPGPVWTEEGPARNPVWSLEATSEHYQATGPVQGGRQGPAPLSSRNRGFPKTAGPALRSFWPAGHGCRAPRRCTRADRRWQSRQWSSWGVPPHHGGHG